MIWFAWGSINVRSKVIFANSQKAGQLEWFPKQLSIRLHKTWFFSPYVTHHENYTNLWQGQKCSWTTGGKSLGTEDSRRPCLPLHILLLSISLGARLKLGHLKISEWEGKITSATLEAVEINASECKGQWLAGCLRSNKSLIRSSCQSL